MKLFDTHAHLDFPQYDNIRNEIIKESFDSGLVGIINIGVDMESSEKSIQLADNYENIRATVGFHPHDASKLGKNNFDRLERLAKSDKVVAIGETGLDFYRDLSPRKEQYEAFEMQIELAKRLNLPLVIHIRNAYDEAIEVLESTGAGAVGGVLHCFAGEEKHIDKAKELGFIFSFNGTITYKNSNAPRMAAYAGLDSIIIETDCPYLAPQAYRGKLNKPSYIIYVADKLSEIFNRYSPEDIARITYDNATELFKIDADAGTIAYEIKGNLYLNITNRCSNNCFFCARNNDYTVRGNNLRLNREPSAEEIKNAIGDISGYEEVVFCGYGEPTYRMETLLEVARHLKSKGAQLRLNTNGQGSLINDRNIIDDLAKYFDRISISLNAPTEEQYNRICKPESPEKAFDAVVEFIRDCCGKIPEVVVSVVDIPKLDIGECQRFANELGVGFRLRPLNKISS
ncbi:MAG: YchF/TatD family DNA exonuclease [candidate division Zixibacteria bacterium]|nr:YchF/TatD family DNA exonuclease [candidate division Zixibacteria bacterium]